MGQMEQVVDGPVVDLRGGKTTGSKKVGRGRVGSPLAVSREAQNLSTHYKLVFMITLCATVAPYLVIGKTNREHRGFSVGRIQVPSFRENRTECHVCPCLGGAGPVLRCRLSDVDM